jgi:hypothetical protein
MKESEGDDSWPIVTAQVTREDIQRARDGWYSLPSPVAIPPEWFDVLNASTWPDFDPAVHEVRRPEGESN